MAITSGRRLFAAALSSLLLAGFLLVPAVPVGATKTSSGPGNCVLIDTDFDIDDMMAIPTVIGNRPVAAIVTSEGYTRPKDLKQVLLRCLVCSLNQASGTSPSSSVQARTARTRASSESGASSSSITGA